MAGLFAVASCALIPRDGIPRDGTEREVVVLVHGLGRSTFSMIPMRRALEREGYEVINWGYPSPARGVEEHGRALSAKLHEFDTDSSIRKIHLVGHSLGGILIRWAVSHDSPARLGRIVLLAPPNRGSAAADRYAPFFGRILRPLEDLSTSDTSAARNIPIPPGVEVGVVAGSRDGKVGIEETHLEGEADHVTVPSFHTFIMARRDVQDLTLRFLRSGRFEETP